MKLLFENYALDATISSLDASANYPPGNLIHPFMRKRYQNNTGDDAITMTLPNDRTVNCLYFGYHNADAEELLTEAGDVLTTENDVELLISSATIEYYLYNFSNVLLKSGTLDMTNQFEAVHFDDVLLVRKVVVKTKWAGLGISGYLGAVGFGQEYDMPAADSQWTNGLEDNSIVMRSNVGQYLQNYIEPQDIKTFGWSSVSSSEYLYIKNQIKAIGKGRPVWVDYFEDSHDQVQPGYCVIGGSIERPKKDKQLYSFSLTFTEAR